MGTVMVQDEKAGRLFVPLNAMRLVPAVAVRLPPQLFTDVFEAMVRPEGKMSNTLPPNVPIRLCRVKLLVFWMIRVSVEVEPSGIGFGEKALCTLAPPRLVSVACASCVLAALLVVVTLPVGMILVRLPLLFIETLMVRSQVAGAAARVPPL